MKPKAYLIKTSIGTEIAIDEEELQKALEVWKTGKIGQFKQGFIRGDLIAVIVQDRERVVQEKEWDGKDYRWGKPQLLKDVFKNLPKAKLLEKQ